MHSFDRSNGAMSLITQQQLNPEIEIHYPDSDGKPMADNTKQFRLIVMIKENLEIWYAAMTQVFIAGDLLWYPIEGDNTTCLAPDIMVAFGPGKGDRGSYQQWKENNIPPQIGFEILSPTNYAPEMELKRQFYETHGIEEYYSFDPDRLRLKGWLRADDRLIAIPDMNGWVSPRLQIRFAQVNGELEIYRPDGRKFLTSIELDGLAQQQALRAEQQRLIAQEQQQRAEEQQQRADRAESEVRQMADQMRLVVTNLLRSGMVADQVATLVGLPIEQITKIQNNLS